MRHLLATACVSLALSASAAFAEQPMKVVPPPTLNDADGSGSQTAVLAGGCYWGTQGIFEHVRGVTKVVAGMSGQSRSSGSGFAGASSGDPPAESVEITYDPKQITYGQLLQIYFSVAHDPTQLNEQGPDKGIRYRSEIFPMSSDQEKVAEAYVAQLSAANVYSAPIVTKVERFRHFDKAAAAEQDYMLRNMTTPYIAANDVPRLEALQKLFPDKYAQTPVTLASE